MSEIISGSDLFMFMDETIIGHATNHTLSVTTATRATTNKSTGKFNTKEPGRMDVTASCEGLMAYVTYQALAAKKKAQAPVALKFAEKTETDEADTAKFYASGNFIITSLENGAPDGDNATWNVSFEHYSDFDWTEPVV